MVSGRCKRTSRSTEVLSDVFCDGNSMYNLATQLFPICRSITGKGVRETIKILSNYIWDVNAINLFEVPTGTKVFDWVVPKEWNIFDGYIEDEDGNKIINFKENNLYVIGYSLPLDKWVSYDELRGYVHTLKDQPYAIPYMTSYYNSMSGFCMEEYKFCNLDHDKKYHLYIDSSLEDGSLTYGEVVIPGESKEEVFFSTYICHPSMANNECSGPVLAAELIRYVKQLKDRKYTYRFIFIPETIGSITYLSTNNHLESLKKHMKCGFNITCVGDDRTYSMVHTRYGDTFADKVLKNVLSHSVEFNEYSFLDRGSDERQYNAPDIDLPVVGFSRSLFHKYPEYHTSLDNLGLVSPAGFYGSFRVMASVIQALEYNEYYKVNVLCEPNLGKRGLYPTISKKGSSDVVKELTNFIAYADGRNDLFDISNIINVPTEKLIPIINKLLDANVIDFK